MQALERIAGLLEDADGSLVVTERGDAASISRHQRFRLFAAMNPATDAGEHRLSHDLNADQGFYWSSILEFSFGCFMVHHL